jgi:hypothetical protein
MAVSAQMFIKDIKLICKFNSLLMVYCTASSLLERRKGGEDIRAVKRKRRYS